jgi:hypothetical protein
MPNALYGFWFATISTSTTGYGDIYPISDFGMLLTSLMVVLGSIYLSVPIAVMCDTFMNCYNKVVDDEIQVKSEMRKFISHSQKISSTKKKSKSVNNLAADGHVHSPNSAFGLLTSEVKNLKRRYWTARETMHKELHTPLPPVPGTGAYGGYVPTTDVEAAKNGAHVCL